MGQKQQLDEKTKILRRSERQRAANRLQAQRENPINHRAEYSRHVIAIISLVLIVFFAYLLREHLF